MLTILQKSTISSANRLQYVFARGQYVSGYSAKRRQWEVYNTANELVWRGVDKGMMHIKLSNAAVAEHNGQPYRWA